jgi:hypothetical protein
MSIITPCPGDRWRRLRDSMEIVCQGCMPDAIRPSATEGVYFPAQRGTLTLFYGIIFLLSGITNFAFTLMILRELSTEKKGLSFFDLRWYVLKNLNTYKKLTRSRYGKVGFPYYGYLVTLAALVLSAILCLDSLAR